MNLRGPGASAAALEIGARHACVLAGSTDRAVPEPFVKDFIASLGVSVPAGVLVETDTPPSAAAAALRGPFAVKAWGPGIVHKSEVGGVRIGVPLADLDAQADALLRTVAGHGLSDSRLYVEEMAPGGVELLFGLVARPPFGVLALLGSGGTAAEVFDDVVVRLCPLSSDTVDEMLDAFRGAVFLRGFRGAPPADRDAVAAAILALAGEGGIPDQLGAALVEFECNPLVAGSGGVMAADARLVLGGEVAEPAAPERGPFDAAKLFTPRSVAVVGASATRRAWGNRTLARYRDLGWTDNLYAVHPSGQSINGVPTYPTLADIPGGVDYAEISLGAEQCASVVRAAGGNVATATITAAGFSEAGPDGRALEESLLAAARAGGVRVVGPNCMGVCSPRGRQGFSGAVLRDGGHVGAVLQSGGLTTDLLQVGTIAGLRFSGVVSAGNATDVGVGELVDALVRDPETETIAVHVEGGVDALLVDALHRVRGRKPVVMLVPGLSDAGSRVAASHTGSLTSDRRGWEALSHATGMVLTHTFEEFLASLRYLDRYGRFETAVDGGVLIMGLGGGASVLAVDACDAHGLQVPVLPDELQASLVDKKGGIFVNPLDLRMGPAGPPEGPREVLDLVLPAHPFADVLVHVDMMNYANSTVPGRLPGLAHLVAMLEHLSEAGDRGARIAVVTRHLAAAPGSYGDEIRSLLPVASVPLFERLPDATAAIAAAQQYARHRHAMV